jgi:hypothetical protein
MKSIIKESQVDISYNKIKKYMQEETLRLIKITEKGATMKPKEGQSGPVENWTTSTGRIIANSKEFFIRQGIVYYLTSKTEQDY